MKKLAVVLCSLALVFSLASCSTANNTAGSDDQNKTAADTSWSDIEAKGDIVIGIDDQFPPMGFTDENGEITGFDIDFAKAVAEELGVGAVIKPIDWSAKEAELQAGNIDLIWNGYTITDERKEKVAFSDPYLANHQIIITKYGYPVQTKDDLKDAKIGVQAESSAVDAVKADPIYSELSNELMEYATNVLALLDLDAANIDAVVMDEVVADYYITQHPDKDYMILSDGDFGAEEYGVGMRKDDKALQAKLNEAMNAVKNNEKGQEITNKWFGTDKFIK